MADRVQVREISNDEGNRLLKMVRRSSGSIVTWRRAQIVLWSAQQMDVPQIAALGFTSEDRAREVIHNFNADGFDSLYPKYAGGRPPKFDADQRREIKQIALGRPTDYDLPFSTWSLSKLGEHLVAKGVVNDISHEGLRLLLREEGVSFQVVNTFKRSNDPDYEAKKNRILHLYNLADGKIDRQRGDPDVVICFDEFGPLNLQPHPGKQWAVKGGGADQPRRTRRATFTRPHGVRHLLAGYDLSTDRLYGHIKVKKGRTQFLEFCRYLRTLHPPHVRIAIVLDNFSPHLSTKKDQRVGEWAAANNVELAYTPFYGSWLNRIEAQFQALRYFALDGTDHPSHAEQARMIRRYIRWRNTHARDRQLTELVNRETLLDAPLVARIDRRSDAKPPVAYMAIESEQPGGFGIQSVYQAHEFGRGADYTCVFYTGAKCPEALMRRVLIAAKDLGVGIVHAPRPTRPADWTTIRSPDLRDRTVKQQADFFARSGLTKDSFWRPT